MPHLSGPRRYFFHHSYKMLSLQHCPSLAGKTSGTRIEKYRALIMPLVLKCKEQHALAHLYNRLARRSKARRLAARVLSSKLQIPFISTLRISFRFGRNRKTLSLRAQAWQSRGNETTNFFCARAEIIHYSLFIINYYAVAARVPLLKWHIPFKCVHVCVYETCMRACVRIMRGRDVGRFLIKV